MKNKGKGCKLGFRSIWPEQHAFNEDATVPTGEILKPNEPSKPLPETMEEFVAQYSVKIKAIIHRLGVRNQQDVEDLEQDVYIKMLKYGLPGKRTNAQGKIFKPNYGLIVKSVVLNWKKKQTTDSLSSARTMGDMVNSTKKGQVVSSVETEHPVLPDTEKIEVEEFLQRWDAELVQKAPWSKPSHRGNEAKCLSDVMHMLASGMKANAIAEHFKVAPQTVSVWKQKLYESARELHNRGLDDKDED